MPFPKDVPQILGDTDDEDLAELYAELDYHRLDEQVNICLECISSSLHTLNKKFLRLSAQATILHLKKFVAKKVLQGMDLYRDVSGIIFCMLYSYYFLKINENKTNCASPKTMANQLFSKRRQNRIFEIIFQINAFFVIVANLKIINLKYSF